MARKRKRINWPYRLACLAIVAAVILYIVLQSLVAGQTFAKRSTGIDWSLAAMAALMDVTIAAWFVSFGACIGSFLNVVAYRLPLGRGIGGNSSCPFCRCPIDSLDNVPVLGWIKLRGRCRSCRLPISMQYPLVEFTVAVVFFVVYVTEFATGGHNLPIEHLGSQRYGFLRITVTQEAIMRITSYLFALSGLIGAALIAVRNQRVPLSLYAWSIAPFALFAMISPGIVPVNWQGWSDEAARDPRLQALATLLCGAVAGLAVGRCLAPILHPGFDRRLLASDAATRKCRQFLGGMAVAGALFGWQASVAVGVSVVCVGILGAIAFRRFRLVQIDDLTVWLWLGVLLLRIVWLDAVKAGLISATKPSLAWFAIALSVLVALTAAYRFIALLVRPLAVPAPSGGDLPLDDLPLDDQEDDAS